MKKIIKDYFSFNSRERVAILLLCCLIAFFWLLPDWYPVQKNAIPPAMGEWVEPRPDSIKTKPENPGQEMAIEKTIHPFFFDPNKLPAEGWKKWGLRDKTILTISHYLEKGGRFRRAEDLRKIWGLSAAEADRMIPYVRMVTAATDRASSNPVTSKQASSDPVKPSHPFSGKKTPQPISQPINLNLASAWEIERLPGMNRPLANRMVKFRDKLGGFKNLDQLRRTYGLSDSVFNLILPLIRLED